MGAALWMEAVSLAVLLACLVAAPRAAEPIYGTGIKWLGALARRPLSAAIGMGVVSAVLAFLHAHLVHWPEPSIHDEFAYIMGAETFADGKLTQPTHAFSEHFESFHILQRPSYAPKYPPGQSAVLAAGVVLFGDMRAGLWLQIGAMVWAITWMLFGWLPSRWAILGGAIVAVNIGIATPWSQSFFGGAVAATGGALVLGAVPRIKDGRLGGGLALGCGLALMAATRPFEGLVVSLPVAVALLYHFVRADGAARRRFLTSAALPTLALLTVCGLGLGLHNRAVTGEALRLPYVEYDAQYAIYPPFLWQPMAEVQDYPNPALAEFNHGFQAGDYHRDFSGTGTLEFAVERAGSLLYGLLGMAFLVPLVCVIRVRRRRLYVLPVCCWGAITLASSVTVFSAPHYAAPGLGALVIVVTAGLRALLSARSRFDLRRRQRAALAVGFVAVLLGLALTRAAKRIPRPERHFGLVRAKVVDRLEAHPGNDLVVVRRSRECSVHHEFVFNSADIDGSPIVWARDLGPAKNQAIAEYYPERTLWLLEVGDVDRSHLKLTKVLEGSQERALKGITDTGGHRR